MIATGKLLIALLLSGLLLTAAFRPSHAHVILDPKLVHGIILDIARYHQESKEGATEEARAESLYQLGEKALSLVELMNQDIASHGKSDLLARLLMKRLQAYGIRITFVERDNRYAYDLAAFREYLKRAPRGKRSAEARFQLIAQVFYGSLGSDPAQLQNTDLNGLLKAVAEEERFLKEYPQHERTREVQFFLAVDYYRLLKNIEDPAKAKAYERLSREALERVVERYPGTVEARAAEALLERLKKPEETPQE